MDYIYGGGGKTYSDWKSGNDASLPADSEPVVPKEPEPAVVSAEVAAGALSKTTTISEFAELVARYGYWVAIAIIILSIPSDSAVPKKDSLTVNKSDTPEVTQGTSKAPETAKPNSDYEQVDENGNVRSHTHYDENGNKDYREDYDHTHYGVQPHRHDFLIDPNTGYKIDEDWSPLP
jgi:hypothetical protein